MKPFTFDVAYTVTRCCECPHFRESCDDSPYCIHMRANGLISYKLYNNYTETIHEDCPERPEIINSEEDE